MKKAFWKNPLFGFNAYENTVDAFIPEFWVKEGLMILTEELVAANLVHRDFSNDLASFGDTVNTRMPHDLVAHRKTNADEVTVQDVAATNVPVVLNQHIHVSFTIKDGEQTLSMIDLVDLYLRQAMRAEANIVDQIILGQFAQFLLQSYGTLGLFDSTNAKDRFLNVRRIFNQKSVPEANRNFMLTINSETAVLATDLFISAEKVGDDGTALREASLGRKFGLNTFKSVFMASVIEGQTSRVTAASGQISFAAGYAVGHTGAMIVDTATGLVTVGQWIKLGGVPYRIAATSATLGATTGITLDRPLAMAVADNEPFTAYKVGAVNQSVVPTGYAAGYAKRIIYDGTVTTQVGQMVSFGVTAPVYAYTVSHGGGSTITPAVYTIIQTDGSSSILLDRPLEAAIADDAVINFGPGGEYNFAFMRNAIALVSRPLATIPGGMGAMSAIGSYNGMAMRATLSYEGRKQGTLVTIDMLLGVKVLDDRLGVVVLG